MAMCHLLVMSTAAASTMCTAMTSVLSSIVSTCLVLHQLIFGVANGDYIHNYMCEKYNYAFVDEMIFCNYVS